MLVRVSVTAIRVSLGHDCFVVAAETVPPGVNQRPGVTLLIGRDAALDVEVLDEGVRKGWVLLFAPEQRRRFAGVQSHYSLTIEAGHALYTTYLKWAREVAHSEAWRDRLARSAPAIPSAALEHLRNAAEIDRWLLAFLQSYGLEPEPREQMLLDFFDTLRRVQHAMADPRAEDVWRAFRATRPGSQAYWSRWLQAQLGISLRSLMQWHKMRRAIEAAAENRRVTSVAQMAGFADSAHLSRVCLRTLGVRPSDVRNDKTVHVIVLPRS